MSSEWYKERAKELFEQPRGDLAKPATEVDPVAEAEPAVGSASKQMACPPHALVSRGTNPGAWVMMWAWIPDPHVEQPNGEATQTSPDKG